MMMEGIIAILEPESRISHQTLSLKSLNLIFFILHHVFWKTHEGWIEILNMATPGTLMKLALM